GFCRVLHLNTPPSLHFGARTMCRIRRYRRCPYPWDRLPRYACASRGKFELLLPVWDFECRIYRKSSRRGTVPFAARANEAFALRRGPAEAAVEIPVCRNRGGHLASRPT